MSRSAAGVWFSLTALLSKPHPYKEKFSWHNSPRGKVTLYLIKCCLRTRTPFYLEGQRHNEFWQSDIIRRLVELDCTSVVRFDTCCFGTTWRRQLSVLAGFDLILQETEATCSTGQHEKCVVWGRKHSIPPHFLNNFRPTCHPPNLVRAWLGSVKQNNISRYINGIPEHSPVRGTGTTLHAETSMLRQP